MNITDADLLDGESLIQTKSANAVIKIDEHGLSRFAFDQLMWTIGMKGKEAIGGKIHLTNYRLIFQSHAVNRLTGKFSIFLPTISDLKDASRFLVKKMHVATQTQQFEFVIWGIPHSYHKYTPQGILYPLTNSTTFAAPQQRISENVAKGSRYSPHLRQ